MTEAASMPLNALMVEKKTMPAFPKSRMSVLRRRPYPDTWPFILEFSSLYGLSIAIEPSPRHWLASSQARLDWSPLDSTSGGTPSGIPGIDWTMVSKYRLDASLIFTVLRQLW